MERPQQHSAGGLPACQSAGSVESAVQREGESDGESPAEQQLVARWIEAFNVRDLAGMLSCTAPSIVFKPLRLHGVERTYIGHDGIARWLERLLRLGLDYQVQLDNLSTPAIGTVLATGRLDLEGLTSAAPAWGVYSIENELIVLARHYLGDEELAERFAVR